MPAMPDAVNSSLAVAQQLVRFGSLPVDGLVVYDIQDEAERVSAEP